MGGGYGASISKVNIINAPPVISVIYANSCRERRGGGGGKQ